MVKITWHSIYERNNIKTRKQTNCSLEKCAFTTNSHSLSGLPFVPFVMRFSFSFFQTENTVSDFFPFVTVTNLLVSVQPHMLWSHKQDQGF